MYPPQLDVLQLGPTIPLIHTSRTILSHVRLHLIMVLCNLLHVALMLPCQLLLSLLLLGVEGHVTHRIHMLCVYARTAALIHNPVLLGIV